MSCRDHAERARQQLGVLSLVGQQEQSNELLLTGGPNIPIAQCTFGIANRGAFPLVTPHSTRLNIARHISPQHVLQDTLCHGNVGGGDTLTQVQLGVGLRKSDDALQATRCDGQSTADRVDADKESLERSARRCMAVTSLFCHMSCVS